MKKMLAKAVALSLVLGGVGFVSSNVQAAGIGPAVNAETGVNKWADVLSYKDGVAINAEAEAAAKAAGEAKAAADKNTEAIKANGEAIKTKADAWDTAKKFAAVQEMFDDQTLKNAELDKKNEKQDTAINANKDAIQANSTAIQANADAWDTAKKFAAVQEMFDDQTLKNAELDKKNENQDKAIKANGEAIKANGEAINTERDQRVAMDNALKKSVDTERDQRVAMDNALKKSIDTERDQRVAMDNVLDKKITDEATNRANEDKRIEAKFDGEVSRLDGRIDKLNDNVQKVGAMAAAIANLHTMGYDPEAPTEIAVGVGQYRDKTGMALGAFHYPNRDFMLSFSVSTAGDEYMGGIGATWKFGRKTPEELRQAEAEKAAKAKLAKAEAAKKAAKDARVAAQQKRHAEMLAARTAK